MIKKLTSVDTGFSKKLAIQAIIKFVSGLLLISILLFLPMSGLEFVACFITAGLDYRLGWTCLPALIPTGENMAELTSMKNIGNEMAKKLTSVGINSSEKLIETGAKQAFLKLGGAINSARGQAIKRMFNLPERQDYI